MKMVCWYIYPSMTAKALTRHWAQKKYIYTTRFIGNIHEIMMILFFYALISYIFCRQNFYNLTKTTHAVFGHTCIFSAGNHKKKNQNNETTCGS